MRSSHTEALTPASEATAVDGFGDGANTTVLAGGTILVPDVTYGRYPRGGRGWAGDGDAGLARAGLRAIKAKAEPRREGNRVILDEELSLRTLTSNVGAGFLDRP